MKLLKRRGDTSTIRKVVSDDRTTLLGIVGQVQDFIAAGIIAWDPGTEPTKEEAERWLFLDDDGNHWGADTREGALQLGVPSCWREES